MTASPEEWSVQDEKLYVELRRKHDRIYAKLRRNKKRVYPYIPHRRGDGSAAKNGGVKATPERKKVAPVAVGLKKCLVCHQPNGSLDVRGRCPKCRG